MLMQLRASIIVPDLSNWGGSQRAPCSNTVFSMIHLPYDENARRMKSLKMNMFTIKRNNK